MPLDKNDPRLKKGGRKGYQYEEAQLKKMRRLLNKDLAIAEKLQNSKELDATDKEKLQILQARVLKYADKLHASRQALPPYLIPEPCTPNSAPVISPP